MMIPVVDASETLHFSSGFRGVAVAQAAICRNSIAGRRGNPPAGIFWWRQDPV
jgi:hypothetical protein